MATAEGRYATALHPLAAAVVAGFAWCGPLSADVSIEPEIAIGLAHTDNLTLAADDPERQTVYQLFPALALRQESTRLTSDVSVRVEHYRYDERKDGDTYQTVDASSSLALDPDNFFLELAATRQQSIRDPEQPIARSNLAVTTNRTDRDDYYVGPRFQYPFGDNGTLSGSFGRNRTRYDEDDSTTFLIADFETDTATLALDNYRKERGFTWAFRYDTEKTDFGLPVEWEYRQAAVELGSWVGNGLRVFAAGGKESAWDTPLDPSLEDSFWEVGIAKRGGADLLLELAAGERTFGTSRRASLDYTFGRGRTLLRYTEQPTTERRDPSSGLGVSELLGGSLGDLLERPGEAQRFLLNRFDWTLSFDLRRTQIALTAFDETREERAGLDGTPLPDEAQKGGSIAVSWALGTRTSVELRAEKARRDFADSGEQDLELASIGAERRLGARTTLGLFLSRAKEEGESTGFSNYEADLISLLLTRTF